jgi:hypothetical protein
LAVFNWSFNSFGQVKSNIIQILWCFNHVPFQNEWNFCGEQLTYWWLQATTYNNHHPPYFIPVL